MGTVTLRFLVDGVLVYCNFLVSDAVDEPMLGIYWKQENNCHWDFVRCTIIERRSLWLQENVLVPPLTQLDVPVWLAWTTNKRGANKTAVPTSRPILHSVRPSH